MATRKAYAKSSNGRNIYRFGSKALRDFMVERVDGMENATSAEYAKAEREENKRDEWGYKVASKVGAYDMGIAEYWDGDWADLYNEAYELGLV